MQFSNLGIELLSLLSQFRLCATELLLQSCRFSLGTGQRLFDTGQFRAQPVPLATEVLILRLQLRNLSVELLGLLGLFGLLSCCCRSAASA
ncbi:MAG: hypothetical protein R3F53_05955 [Gammaproteobacteria bacterium]